MRYRAHQNLTVAALPSAALWRLLLGCVLTTAVFLVLSFFYSQLCDIALPDAAWGRDGKGLAEATTPWGALANLFLFGLLITALALVLPLLHRRRLRGLLGPAALAVGQAGRAGAYILGIYVLVSLLPVPEGLDILPQVPVQTWLMFLPATLLGLLIQVSAEEIVFRGYIQSQLAARFSHPAVWMVLPSILFGLLHYQPGVMGETAWLIVAWAVLFGLAAADLTARSGTLGPAIALHLINNFSAIALIAPHGNFDGLALFTFPFGPDDTALLMQWMPVDLMVLLCSWLAARLALRV
ncbi:CPBP family intramembrane metalloprotease [Pelagivirga sediminicola]|uniref:CPBP family intramembrane metalloprotease n=1 Tax=Pelagivirga sediminicola TaxID=2170575 RepID=A0A2T7G6W4_9RHOB|nr:CPBP family intramembrane glutamic endopeptidase [Pelagivirga sediminicola]PVA10153.1 CPBP family intramembrane metalloprotease [Pelagivirga sediminicola]